MTPSATQPSMRSLLDEAVKRGASDLHLKAGLAPTLRIDGELVRLDRAAPREDELAAMIDVLLTPRQRSTLAEQNEIDFAFSMDGVGRFRANVYLQRGALSVALRHVRHVIPTVQDLNLPPIIEQLAFKPRGLILVTGAVGSGKSTTLAAMIHVINSNTPRKIISIEDPIEFIHDDVKGFITQREVGTDTASFAQGLVHILRQDPDVLYIGEIRDPETMSTALTAADTGRLVLSTLHTADAAQTVNRIISFYPPHQHEQVRVALATTLQAAIAQRLVRRAEGGGRVPAVEILVSTGTVRDCIMDPRRTEQIEAAISEGVSQYGMQTFDQSLMRLYRDGLITLDEALAHATNPHEFQLYVAGVEGASETKWRTLETPVAQAGSGITNVQAARSPRTLRTTRR